MSWKKFFIGEEMPDKEDPKYKKQYESEVSSGRKFAEKLHLDVPFKHAQMFANKFPAAFLTLVFGFVFVCLCLNVYRMVEAYHYRPAKQVTATERQQEKLQHVKDSIVIQQLNHN